MKLTAEQVQKAYKKLEAQRLKERKFWIKKIKLLHPLAGDILIVPSEAHFDFQILSEMIKLTPIKFALVVPKGQARLLKNKEAMRFARTILKDVKRPKKRRTKKS